MDVKYKGFAETGEDIVYIRAVAVADLPEEIRDQVVGIDTLYAVHRPNGERLALVRDRGLGVHAGAPE